MKNIKNFDNFEYDEELDDEELDDGEITYDIRYYKNEDDFISRHYIEIDSYIVDKEEAIQNAIKKYLENPNSVVTVISSDDEYIVNIPFNMDVIKKEYPDLLTKIEGDIYNL
jgi:hypothetical protein